MMLQIIVIIAAAGLCQAQHGHGNHGGVGGEVGPAIDHVEWHFNDKLCLDLLMVDCSKHQTAHDEQICASDGKTYANHCVYVHAYCEFKNSIIQLSVRNHGPCPTTTTAAPTTAGPIVSTAPPAVSSGVTAAPASTNPPAGSTVPPAVTTAPIVASSALPVVTSASTAAPVTTTTQASATTNPNHNIIQNVFCLNADGISCAASGVDVLCGSNGVLYPNQCEFAKAHCKIPTLTHADQSQCASVGK